ncbi:meiotic cell cortex C-terminal pleckstrin homology-domain-containing protein [Talaromyces proteolyticus]|uniref:Meiotic cell cortex C-terminal pleckstrin homology-domain-containing protein n=1 Tax=Talaromyces proteolyticus TaxID=1131652 RepID=A0AAD4PZI7_9EURO|nr:meiotic cell cortex C-terminal pleckstrin homology-domain-containing protein [Talaromyces proteolyticus]KAH8695933.1 meiotic cell cortex C-terminal pleckstrin homology-domain-containing protein [Talaromyces proteolyticus]
MDTEAFPVPSPAPFRTPSRSVSRHRRNSSLGLSSSPPSLPLPHLPLNNDGNESGLDAANDDTISPLDPRRFTPTLHANLVSEILSLRRELECKGKDIDKLEASLDDARTENESISQSLASHVRDNRSLKKQMKLLEGGTLSAMGDIAKERDEAMENTSEMRKRLEQAQKKIKSQEDDVDRTQMLWDRDRQTWDNERRTWERRVHVAENRLKVILNEVAAAQAADESRKEGESENDTGNNMDNSSVRSASAFGKRRTSTTSVGSEYDAEPISSGRFSSMSFANGHGLKGTGLNLADELAFDEEAEEEYMDNELFDERPTSVASQVSYTMATKARKILGLSMNGNADHLLAYTQEAHQLSESGVDHTELTPKFEYRDVGVQYTPPPSPPLHPGGPGADLENIEEISLPTPPALPQMKDSAIETVSVEMASASCQTVDLPSPPRSPKSDVEEVPEPVQAAMVSTSTQTETTAEEKEITIQVTSEPNLSSPSTPAVPMIAIIPPGSEPTSPRNSVVLPPHTKSISCQTDNDLAQNVRSASMQTEEIRVDQRLLKLPASLLPSAIIDQPANRVESDDNSMPFIVPPPRSPYRKPAKAPATESVDKNNKGKQQDLVQAYPGNNDNGPLAEDDVSYIRRPFRSSSLFAGFENMSDDEKTEPLPELPDVFSDDELYSRPTAAYTLRSGRMVSRHRLESEPLEEQDEIDVDIDLPSTLQKNNNSLKKSKFVPKPASGSKQPDIRRTTLISNGAVAHQRTRPRSPSEPSIDSVSTGAARPPPFPVPVRLSSRNVATSSNDGGQSPTPYGNGSYASGRKARRITRQPTLRKVRSATAVQKAQDRARSRSPPSISTPAMSSSSYAPDSPQLPPPLPIDEMPLPRAKRAPRRIPSNRPPSSSYSHTIEEPTSDYLQPTSVVDAIAQTMVGEWMFKYVRRRKSFGMSDTKETWELGKNSTDEVSANITSTGVRHKRWVWLAPYERAVMWSSKQPTSGPALLGKSGRKLTIQSVLDVKDDTPLPKGSTTQGQFNRSILILTPQRALKFTALTLERHYVWLTALSFLSHSPMGVNDLAALPPVPQEEYTARPPTASLRRNHIRDSIRVAKGKPRPQPSKKSFTGNVMPMPEYPSGGFDLDPIMDAADPPSIPRYAGHTRKRSNTAPRAPPSAFRSFSSHATLPSNYSATTANSSDIYAPSSFGGPGLMSAQSSISRRTSEASGPSSIAPSNLFDAVGTIRMEAFIDRVDGPRIRNQRNRAPRKREPPSQLGPGHDLDFTRSEDGGDIYYRNDDLFRGF